MKETLNPGDKTRNFGLYMVKHANNDFTIGKDRLSLLPDCILVDILSLLSIHTAGATCVLSKRWRYLWTQLTHLCFDLAFCKRRSIFNFYANIGDILRSLCFTKIHSLYVNFPLVAKDVHHELDYYPPIESWLRLICTKCPEKIELRRFLSNFSVGTPVTLPSCIFQCQTLVNLKLEGDFLIKTPKDKKFCLPKLKRLSMRECFGDDELLRVLFQSCPVLEELKLVSYHESTQLPPFVDITFPSLTALEIRVHGSGIDIEFHVDAPKLRYIIVQDSQHSVYTFGECPSELYEGEISYMPNGISNMTRALKLIQGVSRARSLDFSAWYHLDSSAFPIFTNLTSLDLGYNYKPMPAILYNCPKLEKLSMRLSGVTVDINSITSANVPVCLLHTLKKIFIRSFKSTEDDFLLLRYILQNAQVLELLDVRLFFVSKSEDVQRSKSAENSKKIFMLPRSSLYSKIIVRNRCLTVPYVHFFENKKKCLQEPEIPETDE